MSFPPYIDEHVHLDLAEMLQLIGVDVLTTKDAGRSNQRISDTDQLQFATSVGRVLVTYNARDFLPIARVWATAERTHAGIVISEQRPAWQLFPRFKALFELYPERFPENLVLRLPKAD